MARVTKKAVDAIKPGKRDAFLWDDRLSGFGVKVTPSGSKIFVFQYRYPAGRSGSTKRIRIGAHGALTPDQARKRAQGYSAAAAEGRDPFGEEEIRRDKAKQIKTVSDLSKLWLESFGQMVEAGERSARTLKDYARVTQTMLLPHLGRRQAEAVKAQDVKKLKAELTQNHGSASANLALRALSAMLSHGVDIGQLEANPAKGQKQFTTRKRERFLSETELALVGDALHRAETEGLPPTPQDRRNHRYSEDARVGTSPIAVAAIRLMLFTGMRRGEVLGLSWTDIDEDRREIVLHHHKTARQTGVKRVPVTPEVAEVLESAKTWWASTYVFPGKKLGTHFVGISKVWDRVRHCAGLQDVRLHDLRHSYASMGVSHGLALPLVGSLLGHADAATTQRYAHLHDDPRRQGAEMISARVRTALDRRDVEPIVTRLGDKK